MVNFKIIRSKKKKGFTLIEMVMVVVILGILSSMAMMKYEEVQKNARLKADYATAATIATAATAAISDGKTINSVENLVTEGYLQSNVNCNTTKSPFNLSISGDSIEVSSTPSGGSKETFYPRSN